MKPAAEGEKAAAKPKTPKAKTIKAQGDKAQGHQAPRTVRGPAHDLVWAQAGECAEVSTMRTAQNKDAGALHD